MLTSNAVFTSNGRQVNNVYSLDAFVNDWFELLFKRHNGKVAKCSNVDYGFEIL